MLSASRQTWLIRLFYQFITPSHLHGLHGLRLRHPSENGNSCRRARCSGYAIWMTGHLVHFMNMMYITVQFCYMFHMFYIKVKYNAVDIWVANQFCLLNHVNIIISRIYHEYSAKIMKMCFCFLFLHDETVIYQ